MIDRNEYIADQQAFLRALDRLFRAVEPMIEAAKTRDEVAASVKIERAVQNLEDARKELVRLALRPRVSEFLEGWNEEELAVLREKLGVVEDDEDEDEED
jgi:hypothetical protein